jgi:hypothetical protein
MRPARAAIEPRRHARARQGMLDESKIARWRPHDDRHLVETDASARLRENPARDLDRLAPLAWRRKELHGVVGGLVLRRHFVCGK